MNERKAKRDRWGSGENNRFLQFYILRAFVLTSLSAPTSCMLFCLSCLNKMLTGEFRHRVRRYLSAGKESIELSLAWSCMTTPVIALTQVQKRTELRKMMSLYHSGVPSPTVISGILNAPRPDGPYEIRNSSLLLFFRNRHEMIHVIKYPIMLHGRTWESFI